MAVKHVTIGIKMDSSFIRMLNANIELGRVRERDELDVLHQLGLLVLMEARGATEEQVHASILPAWRPHIEAVSELRKVEETDAQRS